MIPRCLAAAVIAVLVTTSTVAVAAAEEAPTTGRVDAPGLTFEAVDDDHDHHVTLAGVAPPPNTDFVLDFTGAVDPETRTVVEAAAGIWSSVVATTVPIEVDVDMIQMDSGLLGAAGPVSAYFGRAGFPEPDVLYPVAQANQLAGRDLDTAGADIDLVLSSAITWDKTLDGSSPGQSLLSVALHELGHGLGLTSWVHQSDGTFRVTFDVSGVQVALAYDNLVGSEAGLSIAEVTGASLTSMLIGDLVWLGIEATEVNGGPVAVYAPSTFKLGSSVGHLDEATFTSELMTPFLGSDGPHTAISPVTRAMLTDTGWPLDAADDGESSAGEDTTDGGTDTDTATNSDATPGLEPRAAFVTAVVDDFLGRAPTAEELSRWTTHLASGGSRDEVVEAFAYADEWLGVIVDDLYRSTLGRTADDGGRAHWIAKLRAGATPAEVAADFYASEEYYRRSGNTDGSWLRDLYSEIVGRTADAEGLAFWYQHLLAGGRTPVAFDFYQSLESRRDRVASLYDVLLGRAPESGGWAHWADVLRGGRDVELAIALASSEEYRRRSAARFG